MKHGESVRPGGRIAQGFAVIPSTWARVGGPEIRGGVGASTPMVAGVTADALLRAYDDQLRTDAEVVRALDVVREAPLLWAVFDHGGFVSYRDLGGLEGAG